ncbi:unnamed protein product [Penicillium salamii]|uniref:Calcineurin-like phosphoesterase domain-containing protein n=1 Tax=Penicillium salamii TaxID=1612424 RepID=A0A9W4J9N3_9EURO|nr:unnamed protein product [Penicillium salamii]CAG7985694.1 unnamed protein product [Penicillium salamii]CAG8077617.1 unnamed protein product [Penicillium salamii]CAG8249936.1 unnamed protein product [Penicillium salamii]CAG8285462.1 unnamed protein product [Penicillium salamii]
MKIQIMSDLRLESPRPQSPCPRGAPMYDVFKIPPKAPYLALLGNIGAVKDTGFFSFTQAQLSQFAIVLFVLGNREPYLATWSETKQKLHQFAASVNERSAASGQSGQPKTGSFVFLDQTRYDISSDVTILGCTLFTHDFSDIRDWIVEKHCVAHRSDLAWLNSQVLRISAEEPHRKIVVFTHHSPVTQDAKGAHLRLAHISVLERFATDLSAQECWTNPSVRLWAFGHTHYNVNYVEDSGKIVLSNQRSWFLSEINGTKGFDEDLVVDI